jgi:hypothetical protein
MSRTPATHTLKQTADAKREFALHAALAYLRAPGSHDTREDALNALCAWAKAEMAAGRIAP